MNYEKPEFTQTDAIRAIQVNGSKHDSSDEDEGSTKKLPISCYEDNE
jgi:hypothetical protein